MSRHPVQLLTNLVTRCKEEGVITPRGTQRTDSTHVLANIRVLNRLELVGQTLRAALEDAASTAPDWLRQVALPHWLDDYGPRFEEYRLPKEATKRQTLAEQIGADGRVLLAALQAADAPAGLRDRQAFRVLERIWEQEYGPDGRWRRNEDLPPGAQLLVSPYEQEARWSEKRGWVWAGYKAHLTETCTDDLPLLITHVETTHAAVPDDQVVGAIHTALARHDLLPERHLVDAGYPSAAQLVESKDRHGITLLGPVGEDVSWQAKAGQGYGAADFIVDYEREVAICPRGQTSGRWRHRDRDGRASIAVKFSVAACRACPVRASCTRSPTASRTLTLLPKAHAEALQAARAGQQTAACRQGYRQRAGIEGTISQAVRRAGLRRARYRGRDKVPLHHILTAAALDFVRIAAWLGPAPRRTTRTTPFTRVLAHAA